MRNFQCLWCEHFIEEDPVPICEAFPEGIPEEIWTGKIEHNKPLENDNGIIFVISKILLRK